MRTIQIVETATGEIMATVTYASGDAAAAIDTQYDPLRKSLQRARTRSGFIGPDGGEAYMDALLQTFPGGYTQAQEVTAGGRGARHG